MRRFLADPLVAFLAIGLVLWAGHRWTQRDVVAITPELLDAITRDWVRANDRAPDPSELLGAAEVWVADELRYREGLALGLDAGDPVVRRRLIQKVQALEAGLDPVPPPTDADLQAWLAANPERYPARESVTFAHVYDRDGAAARALAEGADPVAAGAPFPHTYAGPVALDRAERELGADVAKALRTAELGVWTRAGAHLVRVEERPPPRPPTVHDLRATLARDWRADQEDARDARAVAARRARVEVTWPD